jgi:hypothetical protein
MCHLLLQIPGHSKVYCQIRQISFPDRGWFER